MDGGFVTVWWEASDIGFGVALAPISLISTLFMLTSEIIYDSRCSNKSWCIVGQGMFALREINHMERERRSYLEWQLNVLNIDRDIAQLSNSRPG